MKRIAFLRKPWVICGVIGLFAVGAIRLFLLKDNNLRETIFVVHRGDFIQQVSVSGKVVAAQNVDLAFSQSGRVAGVYAKVGDAVPAGVILAKIENGDAQADVLQKKASLQAAEAKLKSLQQGTRPEQLAVTRSSVESADVALRQANQSVMDALRNAYTQSDDAVRRRVDQFITNPRSPSPRLNFSGFDPQLQTDIEWQRLLIETTLNSWQVAVNALNAESDWSASVNTTIKNLNQVRTFLDKVALAVNMVSADTHLSQTTLDAYRSDITAARVNVNAAISALTTAVTTQKNAVVALITAKRRFELEQAGATPEDIEAQAAQVKAAMADLESAKARIQKTLVVAPFAGVITRMDAKVGGIAGANSPEISLMTADAFLIESYVPEINIPLISIGDEAAITLDAYGTDVRFGAKIISLDPAETIRDGVSTYGAKLQFLQRDARVKSGMTANVLITTEKKSQTITVPQGIVINRNGRKFVRVKEGDTIIDRAVETGSVSSLGQIEVSAGLQEGDRVVLEQMDK